MTIKTYSRARTAEAAARAFCEKAEIIAAEIIRHETETGFTCIIMADEKEVSKITTAGWMFRAASAPELPQGLLDEAAEAQLKEEDGSFIDATATASGLETLMTSQTTEAPAAEEAAPAAPAKKTGYIHETSWLEKPTKKVWLIADQMKGRPRKEVIEACRAAGIAYGTARTQYQEWKKANGL